MANINGNEIYFGIIGSVGSGGNIVELTQAEYDALENKDAETLYVITG